MDEGKVARDVAKSITPDICNEIGDYAWERPTLVDAIEGIVHAHVAVALRAAREVAVAEERALHEAAERVVASAFKGAPNQHITYYVDAAALNVLRDALATLRGRPTAPRLDAVRTEAQTILQEAESESARIVARRILTVLDCPTFTEPAVAADAGYPTDRLECGGDGGAASQLEPRVARPDRRPNANPSGEMSGRARGATGPTTNP